MIRVRSGPTAHLIWILNHRHTSFWLASVTCEGRKPNGRFQYHGRKTRRHDRLTRRSAVGDRSLSGCMFFPGKTTKIAQALHLLPDRHGRERHDRLNCTVIAEIVTPGGVCIDIGANISLYSYVMIRLSGSSENMHAFVPAQHIRRKPIRDGRLYGFGETPVSGPITWDKSQPARQAVAATSMVYRPGGRSRVAHHFP
jgi:hypothetical protein